MFIILVDIQSGDRVSLRLLPSKFPIIARASDISRANVAFEIVRRAQDPCSEVVPEDEGSLRATFRDRDYFEVMYRTLQARFTILEHALTLTRPFIANSAFEVIFTMARNLGITSCPLKSICSNPKRRKLLNYFL